MATEHDARWYWNRRLADTRDWTYETKPRLLAQGTGRINQGAGGSYVWAIGSASQWVPRLLLGYAYEKSCTKPRTACYACGQEL